MTDSRDILTHLQREVGVLLNRSGRYQAVVGPEQALDTLGLDSLDLLELAMRLEEVVGVTIEVEYLDPRDSLGTLSERIARLEAG